MRKLIAALPGSFATSASNCAWTSSARKQILAGQVARRHPDAEGNQESSRRLRDRPDPRQEGLAVAVHTTTAAQPPSKHNDVELAKSNILLIGPTGWARPAGSDDGAHPRCAFTMADATTLTEAGYVGEDVENISSSCCSPRLQCRARPARHRLHRRDRQDFAQVRQPPRSPATCRARASSSLLKIMEGTIASVARRAAASIRSKSSAGDTTNIYSSAAGAFGGLEKIISARGKSTSIGFAPRSSLPRTAAPARSSARSSPRICSSTA